MTSAHLAGIGAWLRRSVVGFGTRMAVIMSLVLSKSASWAA